jgi:hypothetical protein
MDQTLLFLVDTGFGWMFEKVHLCNTHGEHLTDNEIDQVYLKNRLAHLSRVRQRSNCSTLPKADIKASKPNVKANTKEKKVI